MGRGFLWGPPHPHALLSLEMNHLTPQKRAGLPSLCKVLCPSVGGAPLQASGRAGVLLGVSQGEVRVSAGLGSLLEVLG